VNGARVIARLGASCGDVAAVERDGPHSAQDDREPGGVMKLTAAAFSLAIKRQVETQQAHLKELLEGGRSC
jgi:hypothetical protein